MSRQLIETPNENKSFSFKNLRLEKVEPRIYTPLISLKIDKDIGKQARRVVERTIVSVSGRARQFAVNKVEDFTQMGLDVLTGKKRGRVLTLIENGMPILEEAPFVNNFGYEVRDFLALSAKVPDVSGFESNNYTASGKTRQQEFVDFHAVIKVSEKKNILLTQVQGRDRTRKEYISGGDLIITVNGKVVGNQRDMYPTSEVNALYGILRSKEIVSCNSPYLTALGINGFVILDYNLPQNTAFKNVQEYSFTAVYEPGIPIILAETKASKTKLENAIKKKSGWISLTDKIKKVAQESVSDIEIQI